ncbi:MAG: LPS assembly protein LptD, partial [Sphingomonadales bacterium]
VVRGDIYDIKDRNLTELVAFQAKNGTSTRLLPHISATFTWPFAKIEKTSSQIIEPIISIIAAPNKQENPHIPNEDSRSFELSDANIFSDSRFPGLDKWESGTRINYGVKWSFNSEKIQ